MQRRSKSLKSSEKSAWGSFGVRRIPRKFFLLIPAAIIALLLIFVAVRLAGQDLSLVPMVTYEFPGFENVSEMYQMTTGEYAVAVNGEVISGNNLGENPSERPTASTAKMILALAIMKQKPFGLNSVGEFLTISEEDYERWQWYVANGGSNVAVEVGEKISEYDALAAVMLPSANNMADTLAIWAFGSLDAYREYATEMLHEAGINHTTVGEDASGFSETTTSTAADLARIGAMVMNDPVLAKIVGSSSIEVPVAGEINNTNGILGQLGVVGVKTGYIDEPSGYCLVSAYRIGRDTVTVTVLGSESREESFETSLSIIRRAQELIQTKELVASGSNVGYYDTWWTGKVPIMAREGLSGIGWEGAKENVELDMTEGREALKLTIGSLDYSVLVFTETFSREPTVWERILNAFGWSRSVAKDGSDDSDYTKEQGSYEGSSADVSPADEGPQNDLDADEESGDDASSEIDLSSITGAESGNCTIKLGRLMLINPNFAVETEFINGRRGELISMRDTYGIQEFHEWNGDNLLDAEAGEHLNEMLKAYSEENAGHAMQTVSCFRSVGTSCGRLCAATGESDHHTGLTCDLIDPDYGTELDSDDYDAHIDWQWLYANSYKYGFIDRFPESWAGGPMSEPVNVNAEGSTGLYETWHYRYVGVAAATEIATGKYNNGEYDSLEHYLLSRGLVGDLVAGTCP